MCRYCNSDSNDCIIYQDPLDNKWYLDHQTGQWDDYDDSFVYDKVYIDYCPWCEKKLK